MNKNSTVGKDNENSVGQIITALLVKVIAVL